jgi:hypothetical protein
MRALPDLGVWQVLVRQERELRSGNTFFSDLL